MPGRTGGKSSLTPELSAKICEAVAEYGVNQAGAAAAAGISRKTLSEWLARGRAHREENRESWQRKFLDQWEDAEGRLELRLLKDAKTLQGKNNIGWRMNMEMLGQRFDTWKKKLPNENIQPTTVILIGREALEQAPARREIARGNGDLPAIRQAKALPFIDGEG